MILLIDNFDSFVHNLARHIRVLGFATHVVRNNALTLEDIHRIQPSHIIISPGPKAPAEAGLSVAVIQHFAESIPILGVCLGHQALGYAFGAEIVRAKRPLHGKASQVTHVEKHLFSGLPNPLTVARYHSLIINSANFPKCLEITARSEENEIMAIQHRNFPLFGVQFHPESILTPNGYQLLNNFLQIE